MSTTPPPAPSDPTDPARDAERTEQLTPAAPVPPVYDANAPYTPPPAPPASPDAQPTLPYATAAGSGQPGYGQPGYGQPGYGQTAAYAPPPAAPAGPDTRPRGLAWTSLILAVAGTVLCLAGFLPVPWVGLILVFVGGFVLLAAFVVALVALIAKRHGGTALSITGLVLSVVGSVIGAFALIVGAVFTGLSVASTTGPSGLPAPGASAEAEEDPSGDGGEVIPLTGDEEAFIAQVRPAVNEIMAEIDPTLTPEVIEESLPDETLVAIGQTLLATGDEGIDAYVTQMQSSFGETVSTERLRELFETIYDAAEAHLQ